MQIALWVWIGLSILASASFAVTYRVSPGGDDGNEGTGDRPFRTIQRAAEVAGAGDEVVIERGVYFIEEPIRVKRGGEAGRPVVFRGLAGKWPVIDAGAFVKVGEAGRYPSQAGVGAFNVEGVEHVRVENVWVRNSRYAGFVVRRAKDVQLLGCVTTFTYGPGIQVHHSEGVLVKGCDVSGANNIDQRVEGQPRPGEAPHEALSIMSSREVEVAFNHVHHNFKEGIDWKETSSHGSIHHNDVHHNARQGIYLDCWFGVLEDVEVHHNRSWENEWGIVLSAEGKESAMRDVRIHHNLVWDNRASGVYFGTWGTNGPREDIRIYQNTIVRNGTSGHWAGDTGGVDLRAGDLRRVWVVNNVIQGNGAFEIATFAAPGEREGALREKGIVIANNLTGAYREATGGGGIFNRPWAYEGEGSLVVEEPGFVGAEVGDFRLREGAAALREGKGFEGISGEGYLGAMGR